MSESHLEKASAEGDTVPNLYVSESTKSTFSPITRQPRPEGGFVPITRLPVEIYTMIFRLVVASGEPETEVQHLLFLCLICRSWRNIVWGTPSLWSRVSITVSEGDLSEGTQLMQACLDRSGNMPLSIELMVNLQALDPELWDVYVDQFTRLADVVKAVSARWENISFIMPGTLMEKFYGSDTSKLKRIRMLDTTRFKDVRNLNTAAPITYANLPDDPCYLGSDRIEDMERYPRPTALMLTGVHLRSMKASWAALTNVNVSDIDISDIFTLLLEAPLLEGFVARESRMIPAVMMDLGKNATIVHGNITTLVIKAQDIDFAEIILGRLNLPRLTNLFISWGYGLLDHELFIDFYRRSCCQLTSLSLYGIFNDSLVAMLAIAPTLSHLMLKPSNGADEGREYAYTVIALFKRLSEIYHAPGLPDAHSDRSESSKSEFLPALRCFIYIPSMLLDSPKIIWDFLALAYSYVMKTDQEAGTEKVGDIIIPKRPLTHFVLLYTASNEDPPVFSYTTGPIDTDEGPALYLHLSVLESMKKVQCLWVEPQTYDLDDLQHESCRCQVCGSARLPRELDPSIWFEDYRLE